MLARLKVTAAAALCSALLAGGCGSDLPDLPVDGPTVPPDTSDAPASPGKKQVPGKKRADSPGRRVAPASKLEQFAAQAQRVTSSMLGPGVKQLYSSIRIKPDPPSGLVYVYTFSRPVDVARARVMLDRQVPLLKTSFRTQVAPNMERAGFSDPSATWTYLNPDGSTVYSRTFS